MDDYHPDHDVKYPDDLPSKSMMAEFKASRLELRKTGDIYSEVLRQMAMQRLDRDMAGHQGEGGCSHWLRICCSEWMTRTNF